MLAHQHIHDVRGLDITGRADIISAPHHGAGQIPNLGVSGCLERRCADGKDERNGEAAIIPWIGDAKESSLWFVPRIMETHLLPSAAPVVLRRAVCMERHQGDHGLDSFLKNAILHREKLQPVRVSGKRGMTGPVSLCHASAMSIDRHIPAGHQGRDAPQSFVVDHCAQSASVIAARLPAVKATWAAAGMPKQKNCISPQK